MAKVAQQVFSSCFSHWQPGLERQKRVFCNMAAYWWYFSYLSPVQWQMVKQLGKAQVVVKGKLDAFWG